MMADDLAAVLFAPVLSNKMTCVLDAQYRSAAITFKNPYYRKIAWGDHHGEMEIPGQIFRRHRTLSRRTEIFCNWGDASARLE
jgi:hypothetical protein